MKTSHFLHFCTLLISVFGMSCTSAHEDFPTVVVANIQDNWIKVQASVLNNTKETVTFVKHPNHYSISIHAKNRNKDELVNFALVSYAPATSSDCIDIAPGKKMIFTKSFQFRKSSDKVTEIGTFHSSTEGFIRTTDSKLEAIFSYGWYPDYLPHNIHNYVNQRIDSKITFPTP